MTQESAEFSNGEPRVRYTAVEVEEDGIPIFGGCHRRVGRSTVVLREQGYDNNNYSSLKFPTVKKIPLFRHPDSDCFRCFHLRLRSPNVLQIFTDNLGRCFTRAEAAADSCPTETHIKYRDAQQLLLFRE